MKCPQCETDNPPASHFCADCGTRLTAVAPDGKASPTRTYSSLPDLETGTLFAGRYQVIEKLGAGGMGRVYKAYDTKVREKIALKIIRSEVAADPTTIERFRHELRSARRIAHPNVCRMFDLGETDGRYFITMEYVPGESLRSVIRMTGALSPKTAASYGRQIALGLAEAHRRGIVHRDLKPQNILIDPAGAAKIMDFGIARSLQAVDLTGEGVVIGTPEFMSPEQAEGGPIDFRTDIYALGVVLYEMTTGKLPFEGRTPAGVLYQQKNTTPVAPRELNRDLPPAFDRLIMKCLSKDPNGRFAGAEALAEALGRIAEESSSTGPKPKTAAESRSGRPEGRRRPAAVIVVSAIGLTAVGLFLFLFRRAVFPPRPATTPAETASLPSFDAAANPVFEDSVAVLPFRSATPGEESADLSVFLTRAIRSALARVEALDVRGAASSELFREANPSQAQIARELDVKHVLEGSIDIRGEQVLVQTALHNGYGFLDMQKTYTRPLQGNVLAIADEIVQSVLEKLALKSKPVRLEHRASAEPKDYSVLGDLRRGDGFLSRYRTASRESDFQAALREFRTAQAKDPGYALTYWHLGTLYEARWNIVKTDPADYDKMAENHRRVEELAPDLAEARLGIGWNAFYARDFDRAYECFKSAYEIAPNAADVNYNIGSFFRSIGLDQKALAYYERALLLNPKDGAAYSNKASAYWNLGQFMDGLQLIDRALPLDPKSFPMHRHRARFLLALKNVGEAEKEVAIARELVPEEGLRNREHLLHLEIWLAALQGKRAKAEGLLKSVENEFRYEITTAYILLDRTDDALRAIQAGFRNAFTAIRDHMYAYDFLIKYPYYDGLRNDPRFQELVREAKEEFETRSGKYGGL